MHIRFITVIVSIYGKDISYTYLAHVIVTSKANKIVPIGTEIITDGRTMYLAIPPLILKSDFSIETPEPNTFKSFVNVLRTSVESRYISTDNNIFIKSIEQKPIISSNPNVTSLIRTKPPHQSVYRALIDINDQVTKPQISANVVYFIATEDDFFIRKVSDDLVLRYENTTMIFNGSTGTYTYNLITGDIKSSTHVIDYLKDVMRNNFPNKKIDNIHVVVMGFEINANYGSIIYN